MFSAAQKMSTINLLHLYHSILVPIFSEWIDDLSLSLVDVAFCSKSCRPGFLNALSKCSISGCDIGVDTDTDKIIWIELRRLGIRNLTCVRPIGVCVPFRYMFSRVQRLESLHAYADPLRELLELCPRVLSLKFNNTSCITDFEVLQTLSMVKDVQHLDLDQCYQISESVIGAIIHQFPNLKSFIFPGYTYSYSSFEACELIRKCVYLTAIDVEYSTDTVEAILESTSLRRISLSQWEYEFDDDDREFDQNMLRIVKHIPALEALSLHFCPISYVALEGIADNCPLLQHINISHATFNDTSVHHLSNTCPLLTYFEFHICALEDIILEVITINCPLLTTINIADCTCVSDVVIYRIFNICQHLTHLDVSRIRNVGDKSLTNAFQRCETLKTLITDNAQLTNTGIVSNIHDVEWLSLDSKECRMRRLLCSQSTLRFSFHVTQLNDGDVEKVMRQCPHLQVLEIHYFAVLTEDVLVKFVECCPLLTSLHVNAFSLTEKSIHVLTKCKLDLKYLFLSIHKDIEVDVMSAFVKSKPNLRKFCLQRGLGCTDELLYCLADNCPRLSRAEFPCSNVTNAGLHYLLRKCTVLCHLSVSSCSLVSHELLSTIHGLERRMSLLNITHCSLITKEHVAAFLAENESLIVCFYHSNLV